MTFTEPRQKRRDTGRLPPAAGGAVCLVVAPCLLSLWLVNSAPRQHGRSAELSADCSVLTYDDASANEVTASPCVTTPSAPVARFDVCQRPLLASIIHVRCLATVIIARIGGLYGP